MTRDHNLLFGVFAVQLGKVTPVQLMDVASSWASDTARDIPSRLVELKILSAPDRDLLLRLVNEAVVAHGGDVEKTLASFGGEEQVHRTYRGSIVLTADGQVSIPATAGTPAGERVDRGQDEDISHVKGVFETPGRYTELQEYGRGGMGRVLLVHDDFLGRDIALKELLPHLGEVEHQPTLDADADPGGMHPSPIRFSAHILARFLQEARITGQLEHPSIVPVYELGHRRDGSLYYTMKLVRGRSLSKALKECKNLEERLRYLPHFVDLCQAIAYAHSRKIIHRDIKPANVMVGEFGETVVLDWGLAKKRDRDDVHERQIAETILAMNLGDDVAAAKTAYGQILGTPVYMAPEQARGDLAEVDERSDVYALGVVLYEILTGKVPFEGKSTREILNKVIAGDLVPVESCEAGVPPELAAITAKAMRKEMDGRYQDVKALAEEVQRFQSGAMVQAHRYGLADYTRFIWRRHKPLVALAFGILLIVLLGGYGTFVKAARDRAIAAEKAAIYREGIAKEQEAIAKEQAALLRGERDSAQHAVYFANVSNARFNINELQIAKARELLADCEPESLREWEWGFLVAETYADRMTVERGGRFAGITPDGAGLITGTVRGTVTLHDLATGEILHEFISRAGYNYAVAGSEDMARIAVLEDAAIHVWDVQTREEVFRAEMPEKKLSKYLMALSGNGQYVAGLGGDNVLRVWDVGSGNEALAIEDCQPSGFNVFLSPDGTRMLVARCYLGEECLDQRFEVYSVPDGVVKGTEVFADSTLSVQAATFSPDSTYVAIATDNDLQVWDVNEFKRVSVFSERRYQSPDALSYSPDGDYLAAGSSDGGILLVNRNGGTTEIQNAHNRTVRSIRFTHNGLRLGSVSDDNTVRLWSVPELRPLHTYKGHDFPAYTLGFSQDDTLMVSSSPTDNTKVWDISAELDKFARVVYNRASGLVAGAVKDSVLVWDARTGHRAHALAAPGEASKALAFNPEGTLIASVVWDGTAEVLRAWDRATGEEKFTFPTGQTATRAIHFINGDSQILLYTGSDLLRFDASGQSAGSVFADNPAAADKALSSYEVSPDGDRLVAGFKGEGNVATALHLPLAGEGVAASIDFQNVSGVSGHFAPDNGRILVCQTEVSSSTITPAAIAYWNLADNTLGELARRHENAVLAVDYSRDGTLLATGDRNGVAALWDAANLEPRSLLQGHAGSINHMDFSPNGKRLVTGSADLTFKIWDVSGGVQLLTVNDAAVKAGLQTAVVEQVTFSKDGLQLATLTSPPVSPMILHAFSTNTADYPVVDDAGDNEAFAVTETAIATTAPLDVTGSAEAALEQFERRMEAYKRQYRRESP